MSRIVPSTLNRDTVVIPCMMIGRTVGHYTIMKSFSHEEYYVIYEENDNGQSTFKKMYSQAEVNDFMNSICREPKDTYDIETLLKN